MTDIKKVQVVLSEEDLHHLKKITGEKKNATAIRVAVCEWLTDKGIHPSTSGKQGGYRPETVAYWRGYNHGKTVVSHEQMTVLSDTFIQWAKSQKIAPIFEVRNVWEKGIADGFAFNNGFVPTKTHPIEHIRRFLKLCAKNGVGDISKEDELWELSDPMYGEL